MYLYFSTRNGQPMEPALCRLYRHTFVPYIDVVFVYLDLNDFLFLQISDSQTYSVYARWHFVRCVCMQIEKDAQDARRSATTLSAAHHTLVQSAMPERFKKLVCVLGLQTSCQHACFMAVEACCGMPCKLVN